jgi:hypothetical protein
MSHLSHIEVAEEFGGPGERPNMTALPDGFPSNSPVTQRNSDSMSRGHVQVGVVDTSACPNRRRYLALSRLRISDAVLFVVFRQSRESCPGQRRLRPSRLLSNALKSQRLHPVYEGSFYAIASRCPLYPRMCCKTLCCIASAQQSNPGGRRDESTLRIVV